MTPLPQARSVTLPYRPEAPAETPKEHPIASAVRSYLATLLGDPLTVDRLRTIGRTVGAAVKLFQTLETGVSSLLPQAKPRGRGEISIMGGGGAALDETDEYTGGQGTGTGSDLIGFQAMPSYDLMGSENAGNTFLRELTSLVAKGVGGKGQRSDESDKLDALNKLLLSLHGPEDTEARAEVKAELRALLSGMKAKREAVAPKAKTAADTFGAEREKKLDAAEGRTAPVPPVQVVEQASPGVATAYGQEVV